MVYSMMDIGFIPTLSNHILRNSTTANNKMFAAVKPFLLFIKVIFLSFLTYISCEIDTYANDSNYQDYLIGDRAIGLGGAFTAIANDPSGLFYNPSGIVDVRHSELQISSSLYGFEKITIDDSFANNSLERFQGTFSSLHIIPNSVGWISSLGQNSPSSPRKFCYSALLALPSQRSYNLSDKQSFDTYSTVYRNQYSDQTFWGGSGFGVKISENLNLGAAVFVLYRNLLQEQESSITFDENSSHAQFRLISNALELHNFNLLGKFGIKYAYRKHLLFGMTISPPTHALYSKGSFLYQRALSLSEGSEEIIRFEQEKMSGLSSETSLGTMIRMGFAYIYPQLLTASADITYFGQTDYNLLGNADLPTLKQLPMITKVHKNDIINFNIGFEYLITKKLSVGSGFFSDFSTADKIDIDAGNTMTQAALPHVDLFGTSFAVSYFGQYTLTRAGIIYSSGEGKMPIPREVDIHNLNNPTPLRVFQSKHQFINIFFSSTFRY